jgi:hypothetical protein
MVKKGKNNREEQQVLVEGNHSGWHPKAAPLGTFLASSELLGMLNPVNLNSYSRRIKNRSNKTYKEN